MILAFHPTLPSLWYGANYVVISLVGCLIPFPYYTIHQIHTGVMHMSFSILAPEPGAVSNI